MAAQQQVPLRPITRVYVVALIAAAVSVLTLGLATTPAPDLKELLAIIALTGCAVAGILRPLNFAYKAEVYLDTAVLILALLTLEPAYALVVAAAAGTIAPIINHRSAAEVLFNASQLTLMTGVGALVLGWSGWDATSGAIPWPESVLATIAAGVAMYLVNTLAVAGMISFQEQDGVIGIWYDMVMRSDRAEVIAYIAQLGLGLLGAIIATTEPWALVLLVIPAIAVYVSLEQHVEMRRRAELNLEAAQRLVSLGSWDWDLRSGDQRWSDELFNIAGLPPRVTEANSERYLGVVHPEDRATVAAALGEPRLPGTSYAIDHRIVSAATERRAIRSCTRRGASWEEWTSDARRGNSPRHHRAETTRAPSPAPGIPRSAHGLAKSHVLSAGARSRNPASRKTGRNRSALS